MPLFQIRRVNSIIAHCEAHEMEFEGTATAGHLVCCAGSSRLSLFFTVPSNVFSRCLCLAIVFDIAAGFLAAIEGMRLTLTFDSSQHQRSGFQLFSPKNHLISESMDRFRGRNWLE